MTYFALLWKARTIEKYRLKYEKEKINSIMMANTEIPQKTLFQKWRVYRYDAQQRISTTFKKMYPKGSGMSNFFIYLKTDRTFPNFVLKSILGFVGGIILTYLCFMFFVFQLSISLIHATIMSSIIGVLLTLGLAFSYRIRCLVFLLIPQFFSRVGRYSLTCYALVLILTGPATNTLKNSEVLSESMACSQEKIKTSVHEIRNSIEKPLNAVKDSLKLIIERMNMVAMRVRKILISLNRLVMSIVHVIQSSFSWLESTVNICNKNLGTPYEHCTNVLKHGIANCKNTLGSEFSNICSVAYVAYIACVFVKPYKSFCATFDYADGAIAATIKKKLNNFNDRIRAMLFVDVHIHHSYSFSSNASRSASQVAAGIVTEIRNRADPLLTWLSWSSCVTSLFLLLIIFRAKYYQHMYETRSRFDNRFVTKELRELDLDRQRQGRGTILPLNRRERAKYITTTSFRLVSTEKDHLNRSAVFMVITTFKLLIHMTADYSLYWVLITIRYHGRFQSTLPGVQDAGVLISGSGFAAGMLRSLIGSLNIPLISPMSFPTSCLPDPYPPDFRRYSQIGVLIILLWFFALFEPYGLRLRHMIMGHYRPERAKTRAIWLYNHILRTRGSFMKLARRKLHREYKCCSEAKFTFRRWLQNIIFCQWLQSLLGIKPEGPICLLCGTIEKVKDPDTHLIRCETPKCPGIFCFSCFTDIGQLCTICLSPNDYGDQSDGSLEKGSSDDNDSDDDFKGSETEDNKSRKKNSWRESDDSQQEENSTRKSKFRFFTTKTTDIQENIPLLKHTQSIPENTCNYNAIQTKYKKLTSTPAQNVINLMNEDNNLNNEVNKIHVNSEPKLEDKKTFFFKKRTLLIPQLRQFKLFTDYFRRKSSKACVESKNGTTDNNQPLNRECILNSKRDSRRLHKLILQLNVFNKSVVVNAYKLVRKTKHQKRSQKLIKRRKHYRHFEIRRIITSNNRRKHYKHFDLRRIITSNKIKQFMKTEGVNNKIKSATHRNQKNKESTPKNLDIMHGECSRKSKPTETETVKPKSNQIMRNNNKYKNDDKDIDKDSEKTYSCTEILHIIWSKYWKSIRLNMLPCTGSMSDERRSLTLSKENKNYKHRKKGELEPLVTESQSKKRKDEEEARKYRIESFLAQQQWINYVYKQEIGHGDKNNDDNAVNEVLMRITNKDKSIKTKQPAMDGIHLKSYPMKNKMGKNSNRRGYKYAKETCVNASGYGLTYIKEEKNRSKSHSRIKEVLARFRKKNCLKTRETPSKSPSLSLPYLKTVAGAVKTGINQYLPPLEFRNAAECNVSKYQKPCLDNKYYKEVYQDPENYLLNHEYNRDGWFCQQNTDVCRGNVTRPKSPSTSSVESCSSDNIQWSNLIQSVSGHIYDIGVGLKKRLSVLKDLYASLLGMTEDKGCSNTELKEEPKPKTNVSTMFTLDCTDKCIITDPTTITRECQCMPQERRKAEKNKPVQAKSKLNDKIQKTRDAKVNTVTDTCTCATQHINKIKEVGCTTQDEKQRKYCQHSKNNKHFFFTRSKSADKVYSSCDRIRYIYKREPDKNQEMQRSSSSSTLMDISSIKSDGTKTDTTVCSLATIDYHDEKKHKLNNFKVKVVTKANQSTLTDRKTVCDVSTYTEDWWSPIMEKRGEIAMEKNKGYTMQNQRNYERRRFRNMGISTEGRLVKFKSRAQIIPRGTVDIMSPSRYLLESQKYYNELFSSKLYAPHVFPVTQMQKPQETDRNRSSTGSRRHTRRSFKNKRLEECYSPRRQDTQRKDKFYNKKISRKK